MRPNSKTTIAWLVICALASGCGGAESRKARHMEKGQEFMAAGNYEKARVEFRNALQIAPTDSEARYENGVVDEKLGNPREAGQFYQGAIDANADNVKARTGLAKIYVLGGAPERALEILKPGFTNHPDDAGLLSIRAAAKSQLKDKDGALADAERAVQLAPTNPDAVSVLAGLYKAQGNPEKSEALLQSSIKAIPDNVDLKLELAQLYGSTGHEQQVEEILVGLVKQFPNESAHRLRLAQFYAGTNHADDAEKTLRDAVAALPKDQDLKTSLVDFLAARRTRESAEKELQAFIAQDPKDYQLRFALGKFYENGKETDKAEAVYQAVIKDAGTDAAGISARTRLAALLVQKNDIAGAEKLVSEVLAKNPRDNDGLILRGNIALTQKDPKTAIADLRSVLRDQPNSIGVMRSLARAHLMNDEPDLAEETMRRAVDANPKDVGATLDLVQILLQTGKAAQAAPVVAELVKQQPNNMEALDAQFRTAAAANDMMVAKSAADAIVALNPKSELGHFYLGNIAETQQHLEDAAKQYVIAADLETDRPVGEVYQALTRTLLKLKRAPEALQRLDTLMGRFPQAPAPANLKGEVLLTQQRAPEAVQMFQTAISRDPKWALPYRNLAMAEISLHNNDAAVAALQNGIKSASAPEVLDTELATMYVRQGKTEDAVSVYETQLKRNPKSDVVANNLAMLLVTYKKDSVSLDRAKELTARFSNSSNADFLDTYGWVLYKRGEGPAAVAALQSALAKTPNSPVSLYHVGMAEVLVGQSDSARDHLSRSLASGKNFAEMDQAKAALDNLAKVTPLAAASPTT